MKLAIVVSGWHFPLHFYKKIAEQKIPNGWEIEMFCVSHRDPSYSIKEKEDVLRTLTHKRRELYDKIMYRTFASVEDLTSLGWKYDLYPNTIGDWGNSNQWLNDHDYRKYDMFLFSHDDNFILNDQLFIDNLKESKWLILTNSTGNSQRRLRKWFHLKKPLNIRGSFEFFKKEMLDIMGGKFDLSDTTLTRENKFVVSDSFNEISDWNTTVFPLKKLLKDRGLENRVEALSTYYRVSKYCIEGERGYIHHTDASNTCEEEAGLDMIESFILQKQAHAENNLHFAN